MSNLRVIHVFDIDNTIADNKHRIGYLKQYCTTCIAPKDVLTLAHFCGNCNTYTPTTSLSEDFLNPDLVYEDTPILGALQYVNQLRKHNVTIMYITGRNENLRDVTEKWLFDKFERKQDEKLYMRTSKFEGAVASVSKHDNLMSLKSDLNSTEDDLFTFYDDDPFALAMYSAYGIVIRCPEVWDVIGYNTNGNEFPF